MGHEPENNPFWIALHDKDPIKIRYDIHDNKVQDSQ